MSQPSEIATPPPDEHSARDIHALDRSLFAGIAWTAVARWAAQAISWAATLYVARILTPADYGLVAMASIPIGLARLVEDLGLDAIIVQDRTLSREHLARLAGAAMLLGGGLTVLFIALSTPVSLYFREPAVAAIVCALSLTFLADSIQVLPRAMLQRDLAFRTLAWLQGLQVTVTAAVVAACATLGLGYWSLVLNTLIGNVVVTIVVYALRPFKFTWPREFKKLAHSLASGWQMMVSRFAWYGFGNLDSTLIGRMLGKEALGVFGFAMTFATMPAVEVTSLTSKVVPGVFSAVQFSQLNLRRYFLLLTEAISYLTLPMCLGLALTGDDFVLLVLGPTWEAVILPLRILCAYQAFNSCQVLLSHVLLWTGRFRANMWLNVFALLVLPACFYLGVPYGIAGVAWGWVIGFPLSVLPAFVIVFRLLGVPVSAYWDALRPAATACLIMIFVVLLVRISLPETWTHALRLTIQSVAGALTYLSVMLTIFQSRVLTMYRTVREVRHA